MIKILFPIRGEKELKEALEEELRKLFYNYTNGHIEISYSETEPVMDVDAFIKIMAELNLCNKHIVMQRSKLLQGFHEWESQLSFEEHMWYQGRYVETYLETLE